MRKGMFALAMLALLITTLVAMHAQAEPWGSGIVPPEERGCIYCRTKHDYKVFNCARRYMLRHQQDPRFQRLMQQGRQSQAQLRQNPDLSLALEGKRACGERR
jgi:hypothetical protein